MNSLKKAILSRQRFSGSAKPQGGLFGGGRVRTLFEELSVGMKESASEDASYAAYICKHLILFQTRIS